MMGSQVFETFKEISIGGISKDQLIDRLVSSGVQFNAYAKLLFDNPAFVPNPHIERVNLVKLKTSDLGIQNPYSLETAIEAASQFGLRPCPLYLAAFLRLEYMNQPERSYLTVASLRLTDDEDYPTGFYIRNFENSVWLRGYRAIGECDHPTDNELVFLK